MEFDSGKSGISKNHWKQAAFAQCREGRSDAIGDALEGGLGAAPLPGLKWAKWCSSPIFCKGNRRDTP